MATAPGAVVITGASSGIGQALARIYAARGASLALVARRGRRLEALVSSLPGSHLPVACDVGDRAAVVDAVSRIIERFPTIHILVNNAGTTLEGPFDETPYETLEQVIRVNLLGAISVTKSLLPALGGGSTIVNVASVAGRVGGPELSAYCASKFGLLGFTESLRAEMAPRGIRVIAVNPGAVVTEGFPHTGMLRTPLGRFAISPERCASDIVRGVDRGDPEIHSPAWLGPAITAARALAGPLLRRFVRKLPG